MNVEINMPDRIARLRDELFDVESQTCYERAKAITESFINSEGEPQVIRRAKGLRDILANMPIYIRDGELIVGSRSSRLGWVTSYPEYSRDTSGLCPPEIDAYWAGKTIGDMSEKLSPEILKLADAELAACYVTGSGAGFGHMIVDYNRVISKGLRAIIDEAKQEEARAASEGDAAGRDFCCAAAISCEGVVAWAKRYAELAQRLADAAPDVERAAGPDAEPDVKNGFDRIVELNAKRITELNAKRRAEPEVDRGAEPFAKRRAELLRIAEICETVPEYPARNFHEALQSFWFVHMALHIEQKGWSISAGRFDQYIFPFYKIDADAGVPKEWLFELLLSLWVKFMENVDSKVKQTTFQNLTLGGQDEGGRDMSNELSHMCLDATLATGFIQPALSVRWHRNVGRGFWDHTLRVIGAGLGMPALFNDEVIMKALEYNGVSHRDALDYGIVGCVEASVGGRMQGMTAGGHINLAKAFELALFDGRSPTSGKQLGPHTGDAAEFAGFEELFEAYARQARWLAGVNIAASQIAGSMQKQLGYCPFCSSLLDDCLTKRLDMVEGGTAYSLSGIAVMGATNAVDCLSALKVLVFEEKRFTMDEVLAALKADFQGYEYMRQVFLNNKYRFGNGIDEVDELANRVYAAYAGFCSSHPDPRGGHYTCGVWPVNGHVHSGYHTGATPDGRRSGDPLVDGVGACQGADRSGPAALIKSAAGLNNVEHWAAGNTCNIKFARSLILAGDGLQKMSGLVETFMALGGQELQINVTDSAELRAAQERPWDYGNLVVRVAGYSAYFTMLSRDIQNEVISRMEQVV